VDAGMPCKGLTASLPQAFTSHRHLVTGCVWTEPGIKWTV